MSGNMPRPWDGSSRSWSASCASGRTWPRFAGGSRRPLSAANNDIPAIDAQAGSILRALREHQMSGDDAFLRRIWPGVRRATDWLIAKDGDGDGLIESNQHNTLDTDWFGPVAWLSGLYLAALSAAATLADEMGATTYAEKCRAILARGRRNSSPIYSMATIS